METILCTTSKDLTIKTVYFADSEEFGIIFQYKDGTQQVIDTFKSALIIIETHDYWCKYTGLLKSSFDISQVKKHLTNIA